VNTEKGVVAICPVSKKKCFPTYKDALRFSRKIELTNQKRKKLRGRQWNRNVSKLQQTEMQLEKRVRSIYICEYCGYYHFSSMKSKSKNIKQMLK
jgi:hypothetical protein